MSIVDSLVLYVSLTIEYRVKSLWAVLHDVDDLPTEGLSVQQRSEIESIAQKGREVLQEIEARLSEYNVLAFKTPNWKSKALRAWARVNWDQAEIESLRNRITSCVSLFNLVMGKINQYVVFHFIFLPPLSLSQCIVHVANVPYRDMTVQMGTQVHSMAQSHESELRMKVLSWICPTDGSERQKEVLSLRQEGTGKWFLGSQEFQDWLTSEDKNFLLFTGIPGAGKTVLASIIIDCLEREFANDDHVGITYLYFDFRQQKEFPELLSTLLRQLLQGKPSLYGTVPDVRYRQSSGGFSLDELRRELQTAICRCKTVFFVIDALDECLNTDVRRRFLRYIRGLLEFTHPTNAKLLVITRHDGDIIQSFTNMGVTMDVQARREDMESFLDANMDCLPRFIQRKPDLWAYIRGEILEAAREMYVLSEICTRMML